MHFQYMTYGYAQAQEPTRKFTILVDPTFVIITTHVVCLNYALE